MFHFQKIMIIISILFLLLLNASCEPAIVSPIVNGYITWQNGEAHKYYENNDVIIINATKRACLDLGLKIKKNIRSRYYYNIIATSKNDFNIKIKKINKNISKVSIRIDFMGDKPFSEFIYKKIDEEIPRIVYY